MGEEPVGQQHYDEVLAMSERVFQSEPNRTEA
jgi:hypothetical protein